MKILVVEDDRRVAQSLKLLLSSFNYAADIAEDGESGLQMADAYDYDLILLDVILPGLDGISVCQQLRAQGLKTPILLLTGQGGGHQKAIALNAGADDYVVKPFDTEELIARLQALLRRGAVTTQPVLTWGSLSIDPSCRQVAYGTHLLTATPKEYAILELFLRNPQNTFSSKAILDHVWRSVESPGEEAVRVHIKVLRHKLTAVGAPKDLIKTIHRVGYRLNPVYSSFLADQKEQEMSAAQIAELKSVNEELRIALEELKVAEEELREQNGQLAEAYLTIELERKRYQDLFEFAPDGYLVTDLRGIIQEANHAAIDLFEIKPEFLIGKSLIGFVARPYIRDFRLRLADLNFIQDWEVYVKPEVGEPFPVVIAVTSIKNQQGEMIGLRWSLLDNRFRKEMEQKLQMANDGLEMRIAERTAELVTTIQTLQQQQSQWQALFDHALDAIAIADDNGCYVDVNPAACKLFGVSREELLGSRVADFADPEVDADQIWQHFLTQGQMSGEFSLYLPDGTTRQTDFTAIANFIPGRHLSILRDITDRKRLEAERQAAEIALRESEESYRLLSEFSPVGIFRNDLEGRCTYANAKTLEITGLSLEQNLGDGWGQNLHPDDRDWMYAAWSNFVEQVRLGHPAEYKVEHRYLYPDGSLKWIFAQAAPEYSANGELVGFIGSVIDVTDRKQAEAELHQKQETIRQQLAEIEAIYLAAPIGLAILDQDLRFVRINEQLAEINGISVADHLGRSVREIVPDLADTAEPRLRHILATGEPFLNFEIAGETAAYPGIRRTWLANWFPLRMNDDQIIGINIVVQEITDRQQSEAALRESERRLSTLMNNLPGYVYRVANDPNYTPEFISEGVFHITGYRQEEYLVDHTATCGQEIHPDDAERVWHLVQQAVAAHQVYECEYRIITKSGTQKWVWERGLGNYDTSGNLVFLEGFVTDITDRKQAQETLRENERQYRQILDSITDMVIVKQPDSRLVWVNKAFRDYYGMSLEELQGIIDAPFNEPDYTLQYVRDDAFVFATGQILEIPEEPVTRHDGVVRSFSTIKAPIYDENGQIIMLVAVSRDITDQKQAEIELRQREEFLSSIYDGAEQAVFVIDLDEEHGFRYVGFNRIAEQFAGMSEQEIYGKNPEAAFGKTIGASFRKHYDRCLKSGVSISYEEHLVFENHIIWTLTTLSPLRNEQGEIYRIIGTANNITDRKQLELSLQASEIKLSQILDTAIASITSFRVFENRNIEYDYYSAGCEKLFGYSSQEFMTDQRLWVSRLFPEDRETIFQSLFDELFAEQTVTREFRFYHKDGSMRWISSNYAAQKIEDGCWQVTVVDHDITDRKHAEFALQRRILREQLVAEISQEIRQSLDLDEVLSRTGERVRELLSTDRVIVFRFRPDWQGDVIMESVGTKWTPILSTTIYDPCFGERLIEPYQQGRIAAISDVDQADLEPCYVELLKQFQVKANLVVPLMQGGTLWGLLIAHHCSAPRQWQASEIDLLQQLATHVEIAIQQSELYQQTRLELQKRQRMQAILEESEERFRTINAVAPIGICQTNADGICLYTNPCWHQMSGLSFEDSLGHGWLQAIHPDDRKTFETAWNAYMQGGSDRLPEFRLLTPQGEIRWVAAKVATMRAATGEVIGYVGIDEDITDRKLAEQKIREQAALLDITSDAILVRNLEHRILYWNHGAERLYGWNAVEAIGQVADEILHNDAAQVAAIVQTLLSQGEWRGELHKVTRNGKGVTVEARWTLVRDEASQPKFILSVDTDITEKKQLEAQFYRAQRLESLGTLASGIAHDLNNVLTPILTISQLLRLKQLELDDRSQEMLTVLEDSAKRGASMVKQILTFTRGTEGDRVPLQIAPVIGEVVKVIQQTFPRSITIRESIAKQPLPLVSANPTHLHQVLMNLCVNARDAMPNGGVLLLSAENCFVDQSIAQKNLDAQVGNYVVISVTDTGSGIPPEIRDRIFEPFFTTKQTGQGTGLGLATVLGIVKNYGGFLQVFSEVEQGTQIKIFLPAITGASADSSQPEQRFNGNGELVLLVDDDVAVQRGTQALLESHQYTTLVANDGLAAIELYVQRQHEIKLVVLDIMMPNMGGIPLIQRLKTIKPTVQIIATSGLPTNREPSLAAGADVFLSKPYPIETLLTNIEILLSDNKHATE